jgi:hypothetical protein
MPGSGRAEQGPKSFASLRAVFKPPQAKNYQSFSASFCSEKEALSSLVQPPRIDPPLM